MLFVLLLALVVRFAKVECGIPIPTSNYDSLNSLACQIAYASSARVTFVYLENTDEELIRCLSRAHLPVTTLKIDSSGLEKPRNFSSMHLLTLDGDVSWRLMQIKRIIDTRIWQKHISKYILIFKVSCDEHLERFFKFFWESGLLNAVALCSQQRIFTYEPFTSDGFQIVRLQTTVDPSKLFYDKLRNLHHYQLRISQFYNPFRSEPRANGTEFLGIDGQLAKTIFQRMNATVLYVAPDMEDHFGHEVNGTLRGALGDVATGVTHASFNARVINPNYTEFIQTIGKRMRIVLIVPKAPKAPQYLNFIRVFQPLTWLILFINILIAGVVFACMQKIILQTPLAGDYVEFNYRDITEMLFKTAIGDPIEGFHKINSLRQFLIAWILFCYVISCIYFAKMESVFVHPEYEEDINSLIDISKLNVPIYANSLLMELAKPSLDPEVYELISSRLCVLPSDYEALIHKITKASHDNAVVLRLDRAYKVIASTFDQENKRPRYHVVKEMFWSLLYTYIVTNGSPFLDKFQTLHAWLFESGISDYFEEAQTHIQNIHKESYEEDEEEEEALSDGSKKKAVVLDIDILQGAFYAYIIGMGLGCLGFIAELCYWKMGRNNKTTDLASCEEIVDDEAML